MREIIIQAFQDIIAQFGETAFINPRFFRGIIEDILGNRKIESSERKRISHLLNIAIIEMKAYQRLKIAIANNEFLTSRNLIKEMSTDYAIQQESAEIIIACICQLLGFENFEDFENAENTAIHIATNGGAVLAVTADGGLWHWGLVNTYDYPNVKIQFVPKKIMDNVKFATISNGIIYAVKLDSTLWAWSTNNYDKHKQWINGVLLNHKPQKISGDVLAASATDFFLLITKNDNSLWLTGIIREGIPLGGNVKSNYYSNVPTKIMDSVKIAKINSGISLAIKTDGSLWSLGYHVKNPGLKYLPSMCNTKPCPIMDDVLDIYLDGISVSIIKNDGSLWVWGRGYDGKKVLFHDSPLKILPNDVAGYTIGAILKKDGSLWSTDKIISAPRLSAKIMDSVFCVASEYQSFWAIKNNGTLWAWGINDNGQLGVGNIGISTKRNANNSPPILPTKINFSPNPADFITIKR
ncbi:MAG: hypothetical protein FWG68_07105 [Defluviitaleaceae bacterium]|nr:hypothetical protein [Defluviitaleaceae bacterium]